MYTREYFIEKFSNLKFKNDMKRRIDDFALYDDTTDEEVAINAFDYWNTTTVVKFNK